MRRLLLIRHAKSSWKYPQLDDHERPLNKRGQRDVLTMSRHLADKNEQLDVIYSSTATRALEYAQAISELTHVELVPELSFYTFDVDELIQIIKHLPPAARCAAVVGHNPAITMAVNRLSGEDISNVPTSAIAALNCPIEDWHELGQGDCELDYFDYPKMFT
ncbi:MAG: histidine phosphatase family protein [Arenicella sp.]|nr:histidine phosphatase family protein [Arenicella sp.]